LSKDEAGPGVVATGELAGAPGKLGKKISGLFARAVYSRSRFAPDRERERERERERARGYPTKYSSMNPVFTFPRRKWK
jgi:hypothetical protein